MALDHKAHRELNESIMDLLWGSRTPTGYHSPENVAKRAAYDSKSTEDAIDNHSMDARLPIDHLLPTHLDYNHPHIQVAMDYLRDSKKDRDDGGIQVSNWDDHTIKRAKIAQVLLHQTGLIPKVANAHTNPHTLAQYGLSDDGKRLTATYSNGYDYSPHYGGDRAPFQFKHEFLPAGE